VLLHPLAVHFPLALWLTSVVFDILAWFREDPVYRRTAYWLVGLGLVGALVSIALGWSDLWAQERMGVGTAIVVQHRLHSGMAYLATVCYGINFGWRRWRQNRPTRTLLALSLLGAVVTAITGYLGGELRRVM